LGEVRISNKICYLSANESALSFGLDQSAGNICLLSRTKARTLIIAQTLMTCGYIPVVCTPPFPIVIVSFFFLGLGMAINLALGNVFAANLHNGTKMLGAMVRSPKRSRKGLPEISQKHHASQTRNLLILCFFLPLLSIC
jgi:hypothetical protein